VQCAIILLQAKKGRENFLRKTCERSITVGDKSPKNTQKKNQQKTVKKTPKK